MQWSLFPFHMRESQCRKRTVTSVSTCSVSVSDDQSSLALVEGRGFPRRGCFFLEPLLVSACQACGLSPPPPSPARLSSHTSLSLLVSSRAIKASFLLVSRHIGTTTLFQISAQTIRLCLSGGSKQLLATSCCFSPLFGIFGPVTAPKAGRRGPFSLRDIFLCSVLHLSAPSTFSFHPQPSLDLSLLGAPFLTYYAPHGLAEEPPLHPIT